MQLARYRPIEIPSRKVVSKLVPSSVLVDQIWVCWWKDWRCLLASGSRSAQSGRLVAASVIEIHRKPTENIENTLDNTKTRWKTAKYPEKGSKNSEKLRKIPLKQGDWDKGTRLVHRNPQKTVRKHRKHNGKPWNTQRNDRNQLKTAEISKETSDWEKGTRLVA